MMHCLAPAIKEQHAIVVMDNAKIHHAVPEVEVAYEILGHEWRYLPAYSPDLNPIENMFSKLKTILTYQCFVAEKDPMLAISDALTYITRENVQGWFHLCNYK